MYLIGSSSNFHGIGSGLDLVDAQIEKALGCNTLHRHGDRNFYHCKRIQCFVMPLVNLFPFHNSIACSPILSYQLSMFNFSTNTSFMQLLKMVP